MRGGIGAREGGRGKEKEEKEEAEEGEGGKRKVRDRYLDVQT